MSYFWTKKDSNSRPASKPAAVTSSKKWKSSEKFQYMQIQYENSRKCCKICHARLPYKHSKKCEVAIFTNGTRLLMSKANRQFSFRKRIIILPWIWPDTSRFPEIFILPSTKQSLTRSWLNSQDFIKDRTSGFPWYLHDHCSSRTFRPRYSSRFNLSAAPDPSPFPPPPFAPVPASQSQFRFGFVNGFTCR